LIIGSLVRRGDIIGLDSEFPVKLVR